MGKKNAVEVERRQDPDRPDRLHCEGCDMKKILLKVVLPGIIAGPMLVILMVFITNDATGTKIDHVLAEHNTLRETVMVIGAHQEDVMADKVINEEEDRKQSQHLAIITSQMAVLIEQREHANEKLDNIEKELK